MKHLIMFILMTALFASCQKDADLYLGRYNFPTDINPINPYTNGYSDYYFLSNKTTTRHGITTYEAIIENKGNWTGSPMIVDLYKDCEINSSVQLSALAPGKQHTVRGTIQVSVTNIHDLYIRVPKNDWLEKDKTNNSVMLDWYHHCNFLGK